MRLFFYALAVLIMAFPQNAWCTDLFVHQPSAEPASPATPAPVAPAPQPEANQPQESAPADTPPSTETISDFAARYYKNCMSKEDSILKGTNQQMLCACSSQKLVEQMTVDDVKTMAQDTPEGQFQRNRLLLQVYAPCMEFPAKALLLENCVGDAGVQQKIPNYEQVCTCMSDSMGKYVAQNGPSIIAKSLHDNPTDMNPLSNLMNSSDFKTKAQTELMTCLTSAVATPTAPPVQ